MNDMVMSYATFGISIGILVGGLTRFIDNKTVAKKIKDRIFVQGQICNTRFSVIETVTKGIEKDVETIKKNTDNINNSLRELLITLEKKNIGG